MNDEFNMSSDDDTQEGASMGTGADEKEVVSPISTDDESIDDEDEDMDDEEKDDKEKDDEEEVKEEDDTENAF